ncbi:MAG: ThiF family adenylyltransferase [bacterium]|nr:ThiF family adenylyltransferase [bacterium]
MKEVIKIVGVGGITNQMLPYLIEKYPEAKLILIDGDKYEKKNKERQPFAQVGANKAIVTASALSAQGVEATGIPSYITPENVGVLVGPGDTVFLAVDNHKTRNIVDTHCERNLSDILLVSGGNELKDGNVSVFWRKDGVSITPPLAHFHPEIASPTDKGPFEQGCLALSRSHPQIAETNRMVGLAMIEAYADIVSGNPTMEIYVSIEPEMQRKILPQERGWKHVSRN